MPHWNHTLDVASVFHDDALPFTERRDAIVALIREAPFYRITTTLATDDDLIEVVDELAQTDDVHYFDQVWDAFYDWCDQHRVWVETWRAS